MYDHHKKRWWKYVHKRRWSNKFLISKQNQVTNVVVCIFHGGETNNLMIWCKMHSSLCIFDGGDLCINLCTSYINYVDVHTSINFFCASLIVQAWLEKTTTLVLHEPSSCTWWSDVRCTKVDQTNHCNNLFEISGEINTIFHCTDFKREATCTINPSCFAPPGCNRRIRTRFDQQFFIMMVETDCTASKNKLNILKTKSPATSYINYFGKK